MLFKKLKLRLAYHNEKHSLKYFNEKELKRMLKFYKKTAKDLGKCSRKHEQLIKDISESLKKMNEQKERMELELYSKKLCAKMARNIQKRISRF